MFDALSTQTYQDFETIVVDSGSFDRTREVAGQRADRMIRISSQDFTFGFSLNTGIEAARGRYIVLASAHTEPVDDRWLERLIAPLEDEKTAMTYGRHLGMACSKFSEVEDFERIFGPRPRTERPGHYAANNANSALRRELWQQHPFDEEITAFEDIEWARHWMERGYRVLYLPEAALYHAHEESWRQIRLRFYREAVARRRMGLMGRRNIPGELARETAATLGDFLKALRPRDNPVAERLTWDQRFREIVYFRLHKNMGTLMGLLQARPLETRRQREDVLFNRTTKAVVIHGPGRASFDEVELPALKPGDALIRVAHVAVCATDLEILDGTLGYYKNGSAKYPVTPGHEFSGRVAALGRNVDGLRENDPVVVECIQGCGTCEECRSGNPIGCGERAELGVLGLDGAYAGYLVVSARFVHKVPEDMDLRRAALVEPAAVVLKGLRRLSQVLAPGGEEKRRCAVVGAGPLGHMCALVLDRRGHAVTAFDRNPKRRQLFAGTGIGTSGDIEDLARFEVIVEVTGDPEALDRALHLSPANSTLLLLGLPYGRRPFSFETVTAYDKTVVGSVGSTAEDFEDAIKLLDKLDLDAYFQCSLPLKDFKEAWEKSQGGDVLKVILDVE